MQHSDIEFTRFADFQPTQFDSKGLGADEDTADWLVVPVAHNRDSDLLAESNWDATVKTLSEIGYTTGPDGKFSESSDDYQIHRFGHWANGWFEIIIVRPESACHREAQRIAAALADYPVLDESDFSDREYQATLENIAHCVRDYERTLDDEPDWDSEELAGELFSWFWENDQSAVESRDGGGGYPTSEQIEAGLLALGYLTETEETEDV